VRPEREAFAATEWQVPALRAALLQDVSHATTSHALQENLRARSWATLRRRDLALWQEAWGELHDAGEGYDDGQGRVIWRDAQGRPHRHAGPSIIEQDIALLFHQAGRLHRTGAPAIIRADGTRRYFVHGLCHRDGGPAVIEASGRQEWWWRGLLHRDGGPAIIHPDGRLEYWHHGSRLPGLADEMPAGDYSLCAALFGAGGCG